MTSTEQLGLLRREFMDLSESDLFSVLSIAESILQTRIYGYTNSEKALTPSQQMAQVEIAKRLLYKQGAEGEITHNENGINRTYGDASGFEDIFKSWGIASFVGTVKK